MSLENKVALITGSSSGIGAAIAILFSKEGAYVAIVGRNEKNLGNVLKECEKNGKKHLTIKADVSKENEANTVVKKTIEKYGRLDILINNAGIVRYGSILDGKLMDAYEEIFNTNVKAVMLITTLAAPHLIQSKGNVVNISSVAALTASIPDTLMYAVSKAALDHFTRGAASHLAPKGVRVNSVNPGPVRTEILANAGVANSKDTWDTWSNLTPLRRLAESEEIADLVLFLASNKAKNITGSIVVSDSGVLIKQII